MKRARNEVTEPQDAEARRMIPPVICYPVDTLPMPDLDRYRVAHDGSDGGARLAGRRHEGAFRQRQDRKSTRLNSSHT